MKKNAGFTLIEVLIAMLVLAIGLLGLAGLQASSLRNNQSAYHRSQATQLAYDIADRMRANSVDAEKFAGSNYIMVQPVNATAKPNCTAVAGVCSTADMAENDLKEWNDAVTGTLPSGQGTLVQGSSIYSITISWDDNRDGNNLSFQMSFQL